MEEMEGRTSLKDIKGEGDTQDAGGKPGNDDLLAHLHGAITDIEQESKYQCEHTYELPSSVEARRQSSVLRYVARMIQKDISAVSKDSNRTVVAVALMTVDDQWRFIVAVNGSKKVEKLQNVYAGLIPQAIGGIPVDFMMDGQHQSAPAAVLSRRVDLDAMLQDRKVARKGEKVYMIPAASVVGGDGDEPVRTTWEVPPLDADSVWQWHSEQKLLRYVKMAYGRDARRSITALGISKAPCDPKDQVPNYCQDYLDRKYLRMLSGGKDCVAAYWYTRDKGGITLSPTCTSDQLRGKHVEVDYAKPVAKPPGRRDGSKPSRGRGKPPQGGANRSKKEVS